MPKNVIIVGMSRSGTSMAAHIFAGKGYFAAKEPETELRKGDEFNPTGYWEAKSIIEANVEIFEAVGYAHHNTWMFEPITAPMVACISALDKMPRHKELVEFYNSHAPWLWKDPRLCYTLGYWWPLMNPETTAVLLLTRNVDQIFQSFLRVGWRKHVDERDEVAERVRAHLAAAQHAIDQFNIPHIRIDYEDFANRSDETARRISDFFGLEICPQDLGFDEILNHSGAKGRLIAHTEKLARLLPAGWRAALKKLIPRSLLDKFFPGRRK